MAYNKDTCFSMEEIETSRWDVIIKISRIIFDEKKVYDDFITDAARGILRFIDDYGYIIHKQYKFVMGMMTKKEAQARWSSSSSASSRKRSSGSSDPMSNAMLRLFKDRLDEKYFGGGLVPFDVGLDGNIFDPFS